MANDLVVTGGGGALVPIMSIEQAIARYNLVLEYAKRVMKQGRDYGVIPGTEKKAKDGEPSSENTTLLKPGAEKLCSIFGLTPIFEHDSVVEDFDRGLFHYSYACLLLRNAHREIIDGKPVIAGDVVGTAIGSCNSREKKYRRGSRACPKCGAGTIKRSKYPPRNDPQAEPGWYCHSKDGGCGREFPADDAEITEQSMSFDPAAAADLVNTIQKMAQKRALIAATLVATNASEFFTQDMEDAGYIGDRPRGPAANGSGANPSREIEEWQKWLATNPSLDEFNARCTTDYPKLTAIARNTIRDLNGDYCLANHLDWDRETKRFRAKATVPTPTPEKPAHVETITDAEQAEIADAMRENGIAWEAVSARFKLKALSKLPRTSFTEAMDFIGGVSAGV